MNAAYSEIIPAFENPQPDAETQSALNEFYLLKSTVFNRLEFSQAMGALGKRLWNTYQDIAEGRVLLATLALNGFIVNGHHAYVEEDPKRCQAVALQHLMHACNLPSLYGGNGTGVVQYYVAMMSYEQYKSTGNEEYRAQGDMFIRKAARNGHAAALYLSGLFHETPGASESFARDEAIARTLYERSANQNYLNAELRRAKAHHLGQLGLEASPVVAASLYTRAGQQHVNATAKNLAGEIFRDEGVDNKAITSFRHAIFIGTANNVMGVPVAQASVQALRNLSYYGERGLRDEDMEALRKLASLLPKKNSPDDIIFRLKMAKNKATKRILNFIRPGGTSEALDAIQVPEEISVPALQVREAAVARM